MGGKVIDEKHPIVMNFIQVDKFRVLPRHRPPELPDHCKKLAVIAILCNKWTMTPKFFSLI